MCVRAVIFLILLLLPSFAYAQDDRSDCLSDRRFDNRVSGRVVYVKTMHPHWGFVIDGYKIVLLKSRCDDLTLTGDSKIGAPITELQLLPFTQRASQLLPNKFFQSVNSEDQWKRLDQYLKPRIGQLVTVTGEMQQNATAYYVVVPQIVISSLAPCHIAPKTKGVEKC